MGIYTWPIKIESKLGLGFPHDGNRTEYINYLSLYVLYQFSNIRNLCLNRGYLSIDNSIVSKEVPLISRWLKYKPDEGIETGYFGFNDSCLKHIFNDRYRPSGPCLSLYWGLLNVLIRGERITDVLLAPGRPKTQSCSIWYGVMSMHLEKERARGLPPEKAVQGE